MASQTTNFGLKKPAYSDTADIGDINDNMDTIDTAMKATNDKINNRVLAADSPPAIPVNSDLNDYTNTGVYRINDSSITATLSNIPPGTSGGGGRLLVTSTGGLETTGAHIGCQIYISNEDHIFSRMFWNNGVWGGWKELTENQEAKRYTTGWGKTLTVPSTHALLMINEDTKIQVWLASTNDVDITFDRIANNGTRYTYYKSAEGSVTFGITSATGTDFSITRSGSSFTFTSTTDKTITAFF